MTTFVYLSATEWGMRWARPPVHEVIPDAEAYVHHTAGNTPADAITALRALNEMAIREGMSALGYDIVVHRNPNTGVITIAEGRGRYMSAATRDRNELGEAVVLMGYFHPGHSLSRQPHPDELEGIARGIVWGVEKGWITRTATIRGHRENPAHPGATACPGDYLFQHLPAIRNRVAELLDQSPTTPTPSTGDDMFLDDDVLASVHSAPPVAMVNDGTASYWLQVALAKAMLKQLTGSSAYTQAAAEKINQLLK